MGSLIRRISYFFLSLGVLYALFRLVKISLSLPYALGEMLIYIYIAGIVTFVCKIVIEYKNKKSITIKSVDDYLLEVDKNNREFCFLLRPFGADGFLFLPQYRPNLVKLLWGGRTTNTVEYIIDKVAKEKFGLETVSLIDLKKKKLAPGPQYLIAKTDSKDEWKIDAEKLFSRALMVFFIFPPTKESTESIEWELEQTAVKKLKDRVAIVFPPQKRKNKKRHNQIIESISKIYPEVLNLDVNSMSILSFYLCSQLKYTYENYKSTVYVENYKEFIQEILLNATDSVKKKAFEQRYPYYFGFNIDREQRLGHIHQVCE